jgi:RNase H-fold protein (predicted Holliday junction resolvase)
MILAVDPGKEKCGLAVLDENANVLAKQVISRHELREKVAALHNQYLLTATVIGQGAFGRQIVKELGPSSNIIFISERETTREARLRYWREHRPKGFWSIIPTSFRFPPVPIDDYAAVIIGERYLKN